MVASGFGYWLKNRYLFCLKQAYNNCYSCNITESSGTTHMENVKQNFLFKWGLQSTEQGLLMLSLAETCTERNYPTLLYLEQNLGSSSRGCWDMFVPVQGRQTNFWPCALGDGLPQAWQILGLVQLLCHRAGPQPFLRALVALATARGFCLGHGPNKYSLQYVCSQDMAAVKSH